ncbi:unnamed protein product [Orchesella dallaii]
MDPACDIFSLGCLYYFVITDGKHPFGERFMRPGNILNDQRVVFLKDIKIGLRGIACIVISMTHKNHLVRPNAISLLDHHMFWKSGQTLEFIRQVTECIKTGNAIASQIDTVFRLTVPASLVQFNPTTVTCEEQPIPTELESLFNRLDRAYLEHNAETIHDVLIFIENMDGLKLQTSNQIEGIGDGVYEFWTNLRFPFLVPIICRGFEPAKKDDRLRCFYSRYESCCCHIAEAIEIFQRIQVPNKLKQILSPFPIEAENIQKIYEMEDWQKACIINNLDKLIEITRCDINVVAKLTSKGILSEADSTKLQSIRNQIDRTHELYKIMMTRINGYEILIEVLEKSKQTGAAKILREGMAPPGWKKSDTFADRNDSTKANQIMSSLSSSNSSFYSQESETNLDDRLLQLVETVETENNENNSPKLKINEESLQAVLQTSEGRQLSIIAVVGPPSSGKSFLLNSIKSALEAKEGGKSFSSSTSNFLNGFKCNTVTDSKSCTTTGIWVWSRAFLPLENDTAVILLDTQGLTNTEASSAIFGLSFLSSSILIYNIEASAFEISRFSPLSTYFKYGFGCLEKDEELSEEEPPFQTLAFLFRDWSDVGTYPYGREGGKSFLNEKLATLRGRLKIETKEGLKCFQQVTPYLIPEMDGFPGSFQDINQEFLTHLEKFIETLLDDENLLPKKIFGVKLNPTDFTNFLKQYVNTYNDLLHSKKKRVQEDLILEVTCTTFHSNILNRCLEKYNEIYKKRRQKLTLPNADDIQNIHESAMRQANFAFKREKKLADYEDSCKEQLHMEMSSLLEKKLKEKNTNRAQYVQACFENAVANFKEKISKETNLNSEVSSELMENSIVEFLSNFSRDDDENTLELAGSLEKELEEILENFQEKTKPFPFKRSKSEEKRVQQKKDVDLEAAKQCMEDLHLQLVQQYEKEMHDVITSTIPTPTPSSLLAYHEHCLANIIKTFCQVSEENPFAEETQTELENSIHQVYTTIEGELGSASIQQPKELAEAFVL